MLIDKLRTMETEKWYVYKGIPVSTFIKRNQTGPVATQMSTAFRIPSTIFICSVLCPLLGTYSGVFSGGSPPLRYMMTSSNGNISALLA